jgi:hypothetical protein
VRAGFTGSDLAWQGAYTADLTAYAGLPARVRFQFGTDPGVSSTGWYVDDIAITNASQPTACSTAPAAAPEVSSAGSGVPLVVRRDGGNVVLGYQDVVGSGGYHVYVGELGTWYSHANAAGNACSAPSVPAAGRRETTLASPPGSVYFLVTTYTSVEGPSGFGTAGEIPASQSTCTP